MRRFDSIVVGSGISGMTMALILGLNGSKVLLLEAAPVIGGSMARFRLDGVPFDTGFHFTGGLERGGILNDILRVLGIDGMIEPDFLHEDAASSLLLEDTGMRYDIPTGIDRITARLSGYFPSDAAAIERYFQMVRDVCVRTPSMDLRRLNAQHTHIDEDFVSLQSVLDSLTPNRTLQALLSVFAMCYGTKPTEISFANHARMSIGLYETMGRVKNGGEAFIKAFKARAKGLDIEIMTNCRIQALGEIEGKRVKRFVLSTGEEVVADNCIFTIHPKGILELLPQGCVSPAFRNRVGSFESSTGFFSVFAVLPDDFPEPDFGRSLLTIMPEADINRMLEPGIPDSAILLMKSVELVHGMPRKVLSLFEPASVDSAGRWSGTTTGKRPEEYQRYKTDKTARMIERICAALPEYTGQIKVLDSASVLTFRDYLHSPDGSAYGIKQKIGQINLRSELPLRNLLAAGQSSLLPGIIGAMMSSFIVARAVLDGEALDGFIARGLDR